MKDMRHLREHLLPLAEETGDRRVWDFMRRYRVRVWNQGRMFEECGEPPSEDIAARYTIVAANADDATGQALKLFERQHGYREPDAVVCFLAWYYEPTQTWMVEIGLPDDPELDVEDPWVR